jgi:hypothetical protein
MTLAQRPDDWRQALSFRPQPQERVIARHGKTDIVLVIHRLDSRKRRSRAFLVTYQFRKHLHYGKHHDANNDSAEIDYHVFIARRQEMAIGALLIARPQIGARLVRWTRSGHALSKRQPRTTPRWKVAFVGVLASRRRKGIARMLVKEAAKYFGVEIKEFGWMLPFEPDGAALVHSLCPRFFWSAI